MCVCVCVCVCVCDNVEAISITYLFLIVSVREVGNVVGVVRNVFNACFQTSISLSAFL